MKTVHILASLVMLMVVVLGMLAAVHIILELPIWTLTKAAEWVAAIGTVGTLAASLWLATAETRRRRRDGIERAQIIASALAPRLSLFRSDLTEAAAHMRFKNEVTGRRETPRGEAAMFLESQYKDATTEELLGLTALDGGYANKLAYAQSQAEVVRKLIESHILGCEEHDPGLPLDEEVAEFWADMLMGLSDRFSVIEMRFAAIAREHARAP